MAPFLTAVMLITLAVVLVCTAILSWWITRRLCSPRSLLHHLDRPNERSLHTRPTPRTGGIAIVASVFVGGAVLAAGATWQHGTASSALDVSRLLWVLGSTLLVAFGSFWDDRLNLPASARFGIHLTAAVGVTWGGGLALNRFALPNGGILTMGWAAVPIAVLLLVWMTNLYNFMDGMDGFAGGMAVFGFGTVAVVAFVEEAKLIGTIALLVMAAAAGFLPHNYPPARIFMGDVGSTFLGFSAGALMLWGSSNRVFDLWVPLLAFSPFIIDASVTLLRRLARAERVWQAHRTHFYQRLVLAGWGHQRTVSTEYLLMAACSASAIVYAGVTNTARITLITVWVLIYGSLAIGVHLVEERKKNSCATCQDGMPPHR